jgi:hypothetical protein
MTFYTGIKFFADNLGIEYDKILAAFSFYSGFNTNNIIYPEMWSGSNSATGYLSTAVIGGQGFYTFNGTGRFNGSLTMSLRGQNFALTEDSTFFISYQKLRTGSEILLSSATGTNFNNCQGYCLGVNDANKLYLKYWNPVEGPFTFTYSKILSDKNLIVVNRTNSILSIGRYDNNKLSYDLEQFSIFNNAFKNNDSGSLFLGGHSSNINWMDSSSNNFSGFVDKFYFFSGLPFQYSNILTSGLYSIPTGNDGYTETYCYTTGYNFNSGFSYTGVTGVFVSGFSSGVSGITGYTTGLSGYSYSGITGYAQNSLGIYVDNCGNSQILYQQVPVSGLISGTYITAIALTGITYITGTREIVLSGTLSGFSGIYITGQVCNNIFNITGDILYDIDKSYLSSLSYSQISLLSNVEQNKDTVEIYNEPYQNTPLNYNTNLLYDNVSSYYTDNNILNSNIILLFANGQALFNSGYTLVQNGYDTVIVPNIDYYVTGNIFITNNNFTINDNLFYDSFGENSSGFLLTGYTSGNIIPNINFSGSYVFYNGQKLISGKDYTGNNRFNFSIDSGNNYIVIKKLPSNIIYQSGSSGTLNLNNKNLNDGCSQVYLNGIRQKINNNYIENSNYDLISGNYTEPSVNSIIYNNTNDYFV